MKKYLGIGIVVLVIVLLAGGWFAYARTQTAAVVNGKPISKVEFYRRLEKRAGKQILDEMIVEELILQEGDKKKVSISEKELEKKLAEMKDRMGGEAKFKAQLKQSRYTVEEINKQLEIQAIVERILGKDIKITDEEINKYYEQGKEWQFKDKKLDEVRGQIAETLKQQKYEANLPKWIEGLKKKAKIVNRLGSGS